MTGAPIHELKRLRAEIKRLRGELRAIAEMCEADTVTFKKQGSRVASNFANSMGGQARIALLPQPKTERL